MSEQNNPLSSEPGRRYSPGRVRSRPGAEVTPRIQTRPTSVHASVAAEAAPPKHLDFTPKNVQRKPSVTKPALARQRRSQVLKRHMVERAVEHRRDVRTTRKRHFAGFLGLFMIIGAILTILWSFWDFFPNIKSVSIPFLSDQNHTVTTPTVKAPSTLDESKPTPGDIIGFQAAADAPRILRIDRLKVEARTKRVGASLTGEPISPSNIFDVGWYDDSGKPGQPGAMLINGHISGPSQPGVFHDLQTLQPNDEITIERGDKKVITYYVVKVQTFTGDQVDMNTALDSIDTGKNGLNLVTSSANYDGGNNQNIQRVIVFAVQQ